MTPMKHTAAALTTVCFLLITFLIPNVLAATIQVDKTATVTSVIDGSSFTLSSGETVKLAVIDTPASGENGYAESKNYLSNLVYGKTVYLTVDTLTVKDQYDRILCVAYLDYNSTHYENVNVAMVQNGYAIPSSTNNTIFNFATMSWFVSKEATATPSPTASIPTPAPTPTPYNQPTPTPSVNPSLLNPSIPEFSAFFYLAAICGSTVVLALVTKKGKKKK